MSELADKLRRLRRDDAPPALPAKGPAPPAWLRERLAEDIGAADPRRNVAAPRDLEVARTDAGAFAYREEQFDEDHRHGEVPLADIDHAVGDVLGLVAKDSACAELPLRDCVYLDVETTGLSGGAGTISFLVALGRFDGSAFRLWQGFLRDPGEEAAMLVDVARRVADAAGVVSFFGKSFDRHRLEDKMRVFGIEPPFGELPHLDLYWPIQRLYGPAFPDGRLQTAERELAGVRREDDLPGSRAPEAWFDFLAGRGHRLEDVFRHNRDDVLSLVVLAAHVGRVLEEGAALPGAPGARASGLARLFAARRETARALDWAERALEHGPPDPRSLGLLRADLLARTGEVEGAAAALEDLAAGEDEVAADALLALAKLYEHGSNDPARAAECCGRLRTLSERALTGRPYARAVRGLAHREERLGRKLARDA